MTSSKHHFYSENTPYIAFSVLVATFHCGLKIAGIMAFLAKIAINKKSANGLQPVAGFYCKHLFNPHVRRSKTHIDGFKIRQLGSYPNKPF